MPPFRGLSAISVSSPARRVPGSAVRRLSLYLRTLDHLDGEGVATVSSLDLANQSGTTGPQVRKDLSHFGSFGTRGRGYEVPELRRRLREILGLTKGWKVALIGAGRVGAALFAYPDFRRRGFEIVAIFDNDPGKVGRRWGGIRIRPIEDLPRQLRRSRIEMVILAVPGSAAQEVVEVAVGAGARGILNFAPVQIRVPPGVAINHVNMAVELESLSFAIRTETDRVPDPSPQADRPATSSAPGAHPATEADRETGAGPQSDTHPESDP